MSEEVTTEEYIQVISKMIRSGKPLAAEVIGNMGVLMQIEQAKQLTRIADALDDLILPKFDSEQISNMTAEQYKKNRDRILKSLSKNV